MTHARRNEVMPESCSYPAETMFDEDGHRTVSCPIIGWGALDGAILEGSLGEAWNLLRELIAGIVQEGKDLPEPSRPSRRQMLSFPQVRTALKAAFREAFRGSGLSQRGLARVCGETEGKMRWRTLNPDNASMAAQTGCAMRRLGRRRTMTVGEAT